MSTVREDIRDGIQEAVGMIAEGESWFYQLLTSQPGIYPRTYGTPTALSARRANRAKQREYDESRASAFYQDRLVLTVFGSTVLNVGDQVVDSDGAAWDFEAIIDSGIGIAHWAVTRHVVTLQGAPNRGGV